VQGAPLCVTVRVAPAIAIDALRLEVEVFGAAVNDAVPVPEPELRLNAIHDAALDIVHAHPAGAVTENALEPPVAPNDSPVGETMYVHATWNVKPFEGALVAVPPGPTAVMRTS
jgi:hypothetical protein